MTKVLKDILISLIVLVLLGDLLTLGMFSTDSISLETAITSLVITYIIVGISGLGIWMLINHEDNLGYIDRRR